MYDVIVVGARCAGSPVAMLLARSGHRVLLLDRATFPSDRLSTHYIQPAGVAYLEEWGLLDEVAASGAPPIHAIAMFAEGVRLPTPPQEGVAYCPRRTVLDDILVRAAVASGAELRSGFRVDEVLFEGGRAVGVAGHGRDGVRVEERAAWVVGADGHRSLVADAVGAAKYRERPPLTGGYYGYFAGLDMGAEIHVSERGGVLIFPTNDGLVCIAAGSAVERFASYREDIEGRFFEILEGSPGLAERVRVGKRVERWRGTADVPNFFRQPWGPGWALVGDAGYMKDPVTGFGITDAFRDASLLAKALDRVLSGQSNETEALTRYHETRDAVAGPIYEFTLKLAVGDPSSFAPGG